MDEGVGPRGIECLFEGPSAQQVQALVAQARRGRSMVDGRDDLEVVRECDGKAAAQETSGTGDQDAEPPGGAGRRDGSCSLAFINPLANPRLAALESRSPSRRPSSTVKSP
jgi:hypothetical protein